MRIDPDEWAMAQKLAKVVGCTTKEAIEASIRATASAIGDTNNPIVPLVDVLSRSVRRARHDKRHRSGVTRDGRPFAARGRSREA